MGRGPERTEGSWRDVRKDLLEHSGGELKPLVVIYATRTNNANASEGPPKASPVQFPISCNAEAREPFNDALARLHSFCKD